MASRKINVAVPAVTCRPKCSRSPCRPAFKADEPAPISAHMVKSFPSSKTEIFVVPPPISAFATRRGFAEKAAAPEQACDMLQGGSCRCNYKGSSHAGNGAQDALAFSFLAVSPVIMTAPVLISSGFTLALSYSPRTICSMPPKSIVVSSTRV